MSELYEGVVFRCDERTALRAFGSVPPGLWLRLVPLDRDLYGIYRVASRADCFDQTAVEGVAERVSVVSGKAVAIFYDNRCGVQVGVLYLDGQRAQEFGDDDAWWVPYGEDGALLLDGPRLRESELLPDEEYDCTFSAIDAALESVGANPGFDTGVVKLAFCYEGSPLLAESGGSTERRFAVDPASPHWLCDHRVNR